MSADHGGHGDKDDNLKDLPKKVLSAAVGIGLIILVAIVFLNFTKATVPMVADPGIGTFHYIMEAVRAFFRDATAEINGLRHDAGGTIREILMGVAPFLLVYLIFGDSIMSHFKKKGGDDHGHGHGDGHGEGHH